MPDAKKLILGTHNKKKGKELHELLSPHGFSLSTLADYPEAIEVVEDGTSFAENAALKASQQATHLNEWVIGEDSGLCVDAIKGEPGIYSARWSGENATDESNNQKLLDVLSNVPFEKRTAHYVSHVALSDPTGKILISCEAYCKGRIRLEPAGDGGFGYDPLFEIRELHKTFGQLGGAFKSITSHRARALRIFLPRLLKIASNI